MRRKDKEITDRSSIDSIIKETKICHLALSDDGKPYVVPMCFGYDGQNIYLHSAQEGKKIDILKKNNSVCVEFDTSCELVESPSPCAWSMKYKSSIAFGEASFVEDSQEKMKALKFIMQHYTDKEFQFPIQAVEKVAIIKVKIDSISGKCSGD